MEVVNANRPTWTAVMQVAERGLLDLDETLTALVPGPYPIVVQANEDTSLSLSFFGADAEWRYVPVGQHVFR